METTKRRSRFKATPLSKIAGVTTLDLKVLQLLQRYQYLPSTYIQALAGLKEGYYQNHLTKLRHDAGLIDCPASSWSAANARYRPAVYALTKKGEQALKDHGLYAPRKKTGHEFNHELMVCLIRASFELGAREHGLELITARDILDHPACPKATRSIHDPWSIPVRFKYNDDWTEQHIETDGEFFGLRGPNGAIMFPGFEADRHTEPLEPGSYERSSIKKKFCGLREIARQNIYKTRFGLPNAIIPFITINEEHKRSIMRVLDTLTEGHGSKLFIFKSFPNFASFENFPPPTGHMVSEPWERVGHAPYSIINELKGGR